MSQLRLQLLIVDADASVATRLASGAALTLPSLQVPSMLSGLGETCELLSSAATTRRVAVVDQGALTAAGQVRTGGVVSTTVHSYVAGMGS